MPITTVFRMVLIAGLLTAAIGVIAGMTLSDGLPVLLQQYLVEIENKETLISNIPMLIVLFIVLLTVLIVSTVGLWKFKNWAKTLYIVLTIVSLLFYPAMEALVMNPWEAMFNDISILLSGILIAMMFVSPINEKFQKSVLK